MRFASKNRTAASGLTLIELLIVIAIIGVLTSMVVIALADSANEAKRSRAKVQVRKLSNRILERWEEFETRSIPLKLPNGGERSPKNSSRVRLYVLRMLMRFEMPERMSDIIVVNSAVDITADVTTADLQPLADYYRQQTGTDPPSRIYVPIDSQANWGGANPYQIPRETYVNAMNDFYYREIFRAVQLAPVNLGRNLTWGELLANQGAECLYLIMKSMQDEYGNALDAFSDTEIGDFDNDGLLEIHDPWGTPISFLRWAPGLSETGTGPRSTTRTLSPIQSGVSSEDPDPFDQMQSDPRFWPEDTNTDGTIDPSEIPGRVENDTFRLVPFVYSAGPDRVYDIWRRSEFDHLLFDGNNRLVNYSYVPPDPIDPGKLPTLHPTFGPISVSPHMNDPYWGWGPEADVAPSVGFRIDLDNDGEGYYDNIDNHFGLEE